MSNGTYAEDADTEYVNYPYLKENAVEKREYQTRLADASLQQSSLVALPTGLGKTIIALIATVRRINEVGGKAVFLAPTKPLVEQQADFYREVMDLPDHEIKIFTGETKPDDRETEWTGATSVVVATPQVVQNDLVAERISMEDVCHITFDECHRATGDYSYAYIAERYWKDAENPLVLGLSASPGTDRETIMEVATNLGVTNIEVTTEDDPSVQKYTHHTEVDPMYVSLDEDMREMLDELTDLYSELLTSMKDAGVLNSRNVRKVGNSELRGAIGRAKKQEEFGMMSVASEAIKVDKCLEVLETQGVSALRSKLDDYLAEADEDGASKAVQRFASRDVVQRVIDLAHSYDKTHPKQTALLGAIKDPIMGGGQAIVFTQSRRTALELVEYLNELGPVRAHRFVGQNNDDGAGMSQSRQKDVLSEFRDGTHNILVSTSVGEEGLDIPQVDLVVFYEPVPSGVRMIQRRGRTGRASDGAVKVLIAKGTRDEGYWHISQRREDTMKNELGKLSEMTADLNAELGSNQKALTEYESIGDDESDSEERAESVDSDDVKEDVESVDQPSPDPNPGTVEVVADTREMASSVPRRISLMDGFTVRQEALKVGDFVLSDRVAVERKSAQDFADTLVEGRRSMFEQMGNLVNNYKRPVLIIEGSQDELYTARDIHENAIRGALQSLAVDFGVSVLWARDEEETAHHLANIAKREQTESDREIQVHGKKGGDTQADQQEYIVSAIAEVGTVTAEALLRELGSVHAVFNAEADELQNAEGVGEVTANRIIDVVRAEYTPEK